MSVVCGCPQDRLCDTCLDARTAQLGGVAASRGIRWAETAARSATPDQRAAPWPTTPRARAIAARKVDDLSSDPRLLARLADACELAAARAWSQR